jgi:hypothetical protein
MGELVVVHQGIRLRAGFVSDSKTN